MQNKKQKTENTNFRVVVVGAAGGIGQPISLLLKQSLPQGSTLVLYDVVNILKGVAVDLSHIPSDVSLEYYVGDMKNPANEQIDLALKGAHLVVVPAGVPRKPGMTRDDLFKINAGIIEGIATAIAKNCPEALIAIITNPVNSVVPIVGEVLKNKGVFNPHKLFGVSTLDIVRAQQFIGELSGKHPTEIKVDVIGGHSAETMLTVLSKVPGVTFTDTQQKEMTKKIADAGTVVVEAKEGQGSATLSMAYAGARFVNSLIRGLKGENVRECCYIHVEGMDVPYFGRVVHLGPNGIKDIEPLPELNEFEKNKLNELIPILKKNIETGVSFVTKK